MWSKTKEEVKESERAKRQRENVVMSTHGMNEREQKKSPTKLIKKLYFFWKLYITRYSFVSS